MRIRREPGIQVKTPAQLARMERAGQVVAAALRAAVDAVAPGVTTVGLDAIASAQIRAAGAAPSFLGYHGYPATICTSINDEIVHGIPSPSRVLRAGDLVSIDCGAIVDGWHADAAVTVAVGPVPDELTRLLTVCEGALWAGLAAARPGARLSDISHAVERYVRAAGPYGIVEDYVGHGIGSEMHMDPPVPNRGKPGRGPLLTEGMAFAVEPLLVLGRPDTRLLDDGWTVISDDGTWSAHFEHTVAITPEGPRVLTSQGPRVLAASLVSPAWVAADGKRGPAAGSSERPRGGLADARALGSSERPRGGLADARALGSSERPRGGLADARAPASTEEEADAQ
jgi:methionyl aminopeptidase